MTLNWPAVRIAMSMSWTARLRISNPTSPIRNALTRLQQAPEESPHVYLLPAARLAQYPAQSDPDGIDGCRDRRRNRRVHDYAYRVSPDGARSNSAEERFDLPGSRR